MSDRLTSLPPPPRRIRLPPRPRRLHVALTLGFIAAASLTLGAPWANVVVRPGPLASPHAQILGGVGAADRCGACHRGFGSSATALTSVSTEPSPGGAACLECHTKIGTKHQDNFAFDPHGLSPSIWSNSHSAPPPSIGCNDCHREHRGNQADLTAISDARCQACHQKRFNSLGHGHPAFELAATGGDAVNFDHASHRAEHYPAGGEAGFDCRQCHLTDSNRSDPIVMTVDYEAACGRCHDQSLRVAASTPLTLLRVPEVTAEQAQRLGDWPAAAVLLGAIDPLAAPSAGEIWTRWLSGTTDRDPAAVSTLMKDLASGGQPALMERLAGIGDRHDAAVIVASVPPQWIAQTVSDWRQPPNLQRSGAPGGPAIELTGAPSNPLLSAPENLLGTAMGDPLAADPLADALFTDDEFQPPTPSPPPQPWGGWSRDDSTLSLQYQAAATSQSSAHADPVITSLINLAIAADSASGRDVVLGHPAIAACLRCHATAVGPNRLASSTMRWTAATPPSTGLNSLYHFSHRPHLSLAGVQDCGGCHVETHRAGKTLTAALNTDFAAITQTRCQECHRPGSARDDCTLCHRYHGR